MSLAVWSAPLTDVAPPAPSGTPSAGGLTCSAFAVLFVAATVIVVAQLVRRRRESRPAGRAGRPGVSPHG